jgi:hypothetical protein
MLRTHYPVSVEPTSSNTVDKSYWEENSNLLPATTDTSALTGSPSLEGAGAFVKPEPRARTRPAPSRAGPTRGRAESSRQARQPTPRYQNTKARKPVKAKTRSQASKGQPKPPPRQTRPKRQPPKSRAKKTAQLPNKNVGHFLRWLFQTLSSLSSLLQKRGGGAAAISGSIF